MIYYDWMHTLLSSGGIAQYACNSFVRSLAKEGVSTEALDRYQQSICQVNGGSMRRLPRAFFSKRVVDEPHSHLKGYAGEALTATVILAHSIRFRGSRQS